MDVATKRAFAAKAYLEAKGYEIHSGNETPDGYVMAVLADRNGTQYVSTINLIGNAVVVNVIALTYGEKDLGGRKQALEDLPLVMDGWMTCAAFVSGKMDGLCSLTVKALDDTTMSISGTTKGYYLKNTGASEYICKLLDRALANTDAGMSLAESYFDANANEEAK